MIQPLSNLPVYNVLFPLDSFDEEDTLLREKCPMIHLALPSGLIGIITSALSAFSLDHADKGDGQSQEDMFLEECFNLIDELLNTEKYNYGFLAELPVDTCLEMYSNELHYILSSTFRKVEDLLKDKLHNEFVVVSDHYYPIGKSIMIKVQILKNTNAPQSQRTRIRNR